MKPTPRLVTCCCLVVLLLPLLAGAPRAAELQAGAAKVNITPQGPIRLSGYAARSAPSEGVDQDLYVRALVLRDEDEVLTAIVSVDAIALPRRLRDAVVGEIRDRTGIYHVRLALAATHSHTAPVIDGSILNILELTPEEARVTQDYTRRVREAIIEAIDAALAKLAPATLEHGSAQVAFPANRRTPGGPVDRSVPVLAVKSRTGALAAVLYVCACHATTISPDVNRVCGDWPGYSAEALDELHPGSVAIPVIGCGADANPEPRGTTELSRRHGRELATAVDGALRGPLRSLPPRTDVQLETIPIRYARLPTREELEKQLAGGQPQEKRLARRLLGELDAQGKLAETFPYTIQTLTFGDELTVVFLAGEVVVDYAIRLRRELAPRQVWVCAYSNDSPGYIPSRRVLAEGGYEAESSQVWYGRPARWDTSIEDQIVEKVKSLLAAQKGSAAERMRPPPPREPAEALATFRVPEDLTLELVAAEPQIADPVQIAFDESFRLYAAEMSDYPSGPGEGLPPAGKVRLLEDRDGDGRYEVSHVFAEKLPFANGITCWQGGVFVTTATELLQLKDLDGDGTADLRQVVYSGFQPGNSQHLANTLELGPEGWIHVNGGDGAVVHAVSARGVPDLPLSYQSFRFHPGTFATRVTTGYRGGFGMAFDGWGARFVCDNQTHAVHVVLEREDLEGSEDVPIDDVMNEIPGADPKVFPTSKVLERYNDPQDYGRFSSACGVHVYGGDALPERYRGSLIACEPVSNLVHREVLTPSGSSFTARRGEEASELLASTDHWFRPVNATTGPDGALYIVDMYRAVIEHPQWIPVHVQKHLDLRAGSNRGRVWRLRGKASPRVVPPAPARLESAALVAELSSPSSWRRTTARRLLLERAGAEAIPLLERLLLEGPAEAGRIEAFWTLSALGRLGDSQLAAAARSPAAPVRAWAARELARRPVAGREELVGALLRDPEGRVRLQAALAVRALPPNGGGDALLAGLVEAADVDPWLGSALLLAAHRLEPVATALAPAPVSGSRSALARRVLSLAGQRGELEALGAWLRLAPGGDQPGGLTAFLGGLGPGRLGALLQAPGTPENLRARVEGLLREALSRTVDESSPLAARVEAVRLVGKGALPGSREALVSLVDPHLPPDLALEAIRALAGVEGETAAPALVETFSTLTPRLRSEVLETLLRTPLGIDHLLRALEAGKLRAVDIDLPRRKALLEVESAALRERAAKAFQSLAVDSNRAAVVERYLREIGALRGPADLANGESAFVKICSVCHRLGSRGIPVGADLGALRNREVDSLVVDILDPSRAVAPELVSYTCLRKDGQVIEGLLATETPGAITIKRAEGKTDVIPRAEIAELRRTGLSVMPQGFETQLDARTLRDVIAYVKGGYLERERAVAETRASLGKALTFHAAFDTTADADFALGDPHVATGKELGADARPGLTTGNVVLAPGRGRHGGALEFRKKDDLFAFYRAEKNFPYRKEDWSGTVSFWLSLDPDVDLAPGYCDPLNVTQRGWNDGAFFVDFTKDDRPRHVRLGAFADRSVWDPKQRDWDAVPVGERPMVDVAQPPFGRGRWTHVAFTWSRFNTGKPEGTATFYLNGKPQGALQGRTQTFTWDPAATVIQIGMFYTGLLDDLAIFDRELSAEEMSALFELEDGVKALRSR